MIKSSWLVCLTAALFFFYEFFQINMLNTLSGVLIQTFSPTSTQLGFLSASYFYGNMLFLFPAGMILDRFPTKTIILTTMGISILGTLLFVLSNSIPLMAVGRFISGVAGGSFCFLSAMKLASRWFPLNKLAFVTGSVVTLAMLGGMLAQAPLAAFMDLVGWKNAVLTYVAWGAISWILIYCFVQNGKISSSELNQVMNNISIWDTIKAVISNIQNWLAGLYTCMLNLPILVWGALWGNLYLMQVHRLEQMQAASVTMMLYVGTIIGSPIVGWISDKLNNRRLPMLVGAAGSLLTILGVILLPNATWLILIALFLLIGLFSSAQTLGYPVVSESNSPHLVGSALGFATVIVMSGGAIFQPLFGWLLSLNWNGYIQNTVPVYTAENYGIAVLLLPIAACFALLCVMVLREPKK